jgi:hypothetical protein
MREIFYTFDPDEQPPDPTVNSTKYQETITYQAGYYKAIAREDGELSTITSRNFGVVPEDYIAYYKFDGNANDETGNYNAVNNGATLATGVKGIADTAYSFNNTQIDVITTNFNLSNCFISFWFNSEASTSYPAIISNNASGFWSGGFNIRHNNSGLSNKISIHWNGGQGGNQDPALVSNSTYSKSQWHHCVVVKDGTMLYLYVNGVLDNSRTINNVNLNLSNGGKCVFGKFPADGVNGSFKGKLDLVIIYQRAISASEALEIYGSE